MLIRLLAEPAAAYERSTVLGLHGSGIDRAASLFQQLNPANPLFRGSVTTRALHRGQHLYRPQDTRAHVYLILRGTLKTYRLLHDCKERISGFHMAGELLGLDALFGLPVRRGAIALGSAVVSVIPVAMLLDYLGRSEATRLELLGQFYNEIARLEEHLSLDQRTAEERLATFVLWALDKLAGPATIKVNLPMSQKDIGNYLGLVPETVSRLLAKFQHRRWLSMERREWTVRDIDQLRQAARGVASTSAGESPSRVRHAETWAAAGAP